MVDLVSLGDVVPILRPVTYFPLLVGTKVVIFSVNAKISYYHGPDMEMTSSKVKK